jgi:transglutaminase-like putative cysteine protease
MKLNQFFILIGVLCFTVSAQARWETRDDANTEIQFYNRSIDIQSDGTYVETIELKTVPTKEDGGENLATQPFYYDTEAGDFKVLEAYTLYQGQTYKVDSDSIENKPVASTTMGLQKLGQVLIKYPHVKKGAELYLQYRQKVKIPSLPNFFSTQFVYGQEGYWLTSHVKVTSDLPFTIKKNDPESYLELKHGESAGRYFMEIDLKRPIIKRVIDEVMPNVNLKHFPWVTLSTIKEWQDLAKKMVEPYERVAAQKLPDVYSKIAEEASKKAKLEDKINTVTSLLAEHMKYMGDWRSVYNRWFPRDLEAISSSGQGDCKDFAISTVAILRKIGIESHVAAVYRGENAYLPPVDLPDLYSFNHVIVRVKNESSTNSRNVLWIDPTHLASFAQGIFPDIADRWALVFNPTSPGRERTHSIQSSESKITIHESQDVSSPGQLVKNGEIHFQGASAVFFTGAALMASREALDYSLMRMVSDENRIQRWKFADYDLHSRIVADLSFHYEVQEKYAELKTDVGPGYVLQPGYHSSVLLVRTQDRVSDLSLGTAAQVEKTYMLKNVARFKKQFKGCRIKSSWADFSREISDLKAGVQIQDRILVKQPFLSVEELQSKKFIRFQDELEKCFNGVAIIYKLNLKGKFNHSEL